MVSTGGWEAFKERDYGKIELNAGPQEIRMRSGGKFKGALIDLRVIELKPAN